MSRSPCNHSTILVRFLQSILCTLSAASLCESARKSFQRNRLEVINTEDQIIMEEEVQKRQPDATFIQEIDGRPYHVRVFFPEGTAATLQEKTEQMLRMEMMRIADEGAG